MATRNFVPRKDGEGSIGKASKHWRAVYTNHINTLRRNQYYNNGDVAYIDLIPTWARLTCAQEGTTAAILPRELNDHFYVPGLIFTDGTVIWIVDDTRDGTPFGSVRGDVRVPAGYVKANGATVLRADYPRLVAYATSFDYWTDDPISYPGRYGRGNGSTTMVLPNYTDRMIQFAADGIGQGVTAGLPNIIGELNGSYGLVTSKMSDSNKVTGMFAVKKITEASFTGGGRDETVSVQADASRCSPIYGRSSTVQPAAIKLIPIIRY